VIAIELALALLLAVLVSGYIVRALPIPLPLPIVQIVLGWIISNRLHQGVQLRPEVFFLLFLPPLLFLDGWRISKDGLLRDKGAILQMAFGLVVFTVIGAGYLIHWLIPAMPLAVAFALAAIVSPTDPVAVSSIGAHAPVPKRMMHILEGESLLNDASGLVCFQFAVAAVLTGSFSLGAATLTFLWVALAGLLCGVVFTLAVTWIQQRLTRRFGQEGGSPILINLLMPFGAWLLADALHASGILAAVAAGITMSYVELTGRAMAKTRVERAAVWNTIEFALNGVMFVLLGEQLPRIVHGAIATVEQSGHRNPWWLAVYAIAITLGLALLRLVWVWLSLRFYAVRRRRAGDPLKHTGWRVVLATTLAGARGAITLAGILTLPLLLPNGSPFPVRDLAIFIAAAVIVLSLVGASVGLPPLLKKLERPLESGAGQEGDHARAVAAHAAITAVRNALSEMQQSAPADAGICAGAASRVITLYRRRIHDDVLEDTDAEKLRRSDAIERQLRLVALEHERKEIMAMTLGHRISEETSRRLLRDIDLVEMLYR